MLTLKNFLRRELEKQRVVLFYWLPVALACGIGCYLSLRQEPAPNLFIAMALLGGISYLGYHFQICSLAPFFLLLAVFCLGFYAVAGKAHYVAAPTLTYRFYGEIEGRIIGVDRARSGAVRVTLDQVELENISKSNTPHKVRLSISDAPAAQLLTPQGRLKTKGSLSPLRARPNLEGLISGVTLGFEGSGPWVIRGKGCRSPLARHPEFFRGFSTKEWRFLRG